MSKVIRTYQIATELVSLPDGQFHRATFILGENTEGLSATARSADMAAGLLLREFSSRLCAGAVKGLTQEKPKGTF